MSIKNMIAQLGQGMLTSVLIYTLTLIGAVPLALPLALARGGKSKIARLLTGAYISFMRGTPLMLQLLILYFIIFATVNIDKTLVAILAFGLNSAAYVAVYKPGRPPPPYLRDSAKPQPCWDIPMRRRFSA